MVAVQMSGADEDLRTMMASKGIKSALQNIDTGEPTARSYVQLAHYHIRAGRLEPGLYYLEVALSMDSESLVKLILTIAQWDQINALWNPCNFLF